jgi:glycine dehydrogenase
MTTTESRPADRVVTDDEVDLPLTELADFVGRHIGPRDEELEVMLAEVGQGSLESLVAAALPAGIRTESPLSLAAAPSEQSVIDELQALASRNQVLTSMIGLGYYGTHIPPVVRRNVLENPAWYTAYTPYQPEISQGRLEALLNFQTMCSDLTALETSGASLLDEATAAAEAMTVMRRSSKVAQDAVLVVDRHVLPQTHAVLATRSTPLGIDVVTADLSDVRDTESLSDAAGGRPVFGVIVQYPGADGLVRDFRALTEAAHGAGALVTAACDLLALTLLTPPGELGAPTSRSAPPSGSACRWATAARTPATSRCATGSSAPARPPGRRPSTPPAIPAYRLALQTREQHIRREKATSNICTAQVLLAVIASMYAVWHGPDGLRAHRRRVHAQAARSPTVLRRRRRRGRARRRSSTPCSRHGPGPGRRRRGAAARGGQPRPVDDDHVRIACDETTRPEHLAAVLARSGWPRAAGTSAPRDAAARVMARTPGYLDHPVFHEHRSETRCCATCAARRRRLALDRGMIPLGSCTMKLNATTEMEPITWPEFAALHPFAPAEQAAGLPRADRRARALARRDHRLRRRERAAQRRLAGRARRAARHRGLPPLTRRRAARRVPDPVQRPRHQRGQRRDGRHAGGGGRAATTTATSTSTTCARSSPSTRPLAAIMVTYPSTHGVYEDTSPRCAGSCTRPAGRSTSTAPTSTRCSASAKPGEFGGDVSHLNLHKTFCIPHGGGGPGVGPVGCASTSRRSCPNHPLHPDPGPS